MQTSKIKNLVSRVSGETLIEIMIAVSVLMIALAPASALYIDSIKSTAANRDYLIVEALAEEGIELVKNIRDTNFLRFSAKAEECWNAKLEADISNCDTKTIEKGSYKISTNAGLEIMTVAFDAAKPSDVYKLKLDSTGLYSHNSGIDTNFYREIKLEKLDTNSMFVSSRVFFKSGAKLKDIFRTTVLTSTLK